ncbi:PQQ-binding-like beta-propeller repeat protein [Elongatibacter sediminis]|uniref:PQQ-binding-like beta-propeller repeat protein n=1 Tax=Elongatibacter sediminis TaxID=3119006 RepID=A0AAW9RH18_9GAMM
MIRILVRLISVLLIGGVPACTSTSGSDSAAPAQEPPPGEVAYLEHCAACHDQAVYKAPSRLFLGMLGPDNILKAMDDGVMREQARAVGPATRRDIAEFLSGRSLDDVADRRLPPSCSETGAPAFDTLKPPGSHGWGVDRANSRFYPEAVGGLTVADAPDLELKWAFAYPNAIQARSQPVVGAGAVHVGGPDGTVWALDAKTGCLRWTFRATAEVRTGIVMSSWDENDAGSATLYFGDILARAYAVDAVSGRLKWMTKVDGHPNATITGTPTLYGDRLYVPVSSLEVTLAADPRYACCTFRGSVVALDIATGEPVWQSHSIDQEPQPAGTTRAGTPIMAPSGAPIWNSPTIDVGRQRLYVGTGENYSSPAGPTSDAIIAMNLRSGRKIWVSQQTEGDAWNVGCLTQYTSDDANCPEENGPDFDFAASPILVALDSGTDILVAGQKSGAVMGIDPVTGRTMWRTHVGRGGVQGGVHFGMAAEGSRIYVPISDMFYPEDLTRYRFETPARPGMYALDARTGELLWATPASDVCDGREFCNPGISQAVSAIPGAVIAGHMDGRLRIYDGTDGGVLWEMDTLREFDTVSGEIARGGSFGGGGPVVADGMMYVNSGYGLYFHMPGNVLLAFGRRDSADRRDP